MHDVIYLDYNATTPLDPSALEAMLPWLTEICANPSSQHVLGRTANRAVSDAREHLGALLNASPNELILTSGATEADNLALIGFAADLHGDRHRIVSCVTEHKAVLEPLQHLEDRGLKVDLLPVTRQGLIDLDQFREAVTSDVALASVMTVNNETGVIQPIPQLAEIAHAAGALFHTDATQAVGRLPFDVEQAQVDLASLSAHKMYGPKGIGALYVRRGTPITPLLFGGGQERDLRPGTLNVPSIVGMGAAARLASSQLQSDDSHLCTLRRALIDLLRDQISEIEFTTFDTAAGAGPYVAPGTLNVRFVGADAEAVLANCPNVAISTGSACTSGIPGPSHVLEAMLSDHTAASECVRISLGRPTTLDELRLAVSDIAEAVHFVRSMG